MRLWLPGGWGKGQFGMDMCTLLYLKWITNKVLLYRDFPGSSEGKVSAYMRETQVQSPGWEDHLDKAMTTHSSTLSWKIPWTEEPGKLQSMESESDTTSLSLSLSTFILTWQCPSHPWKLLHNLWPNRNLCSFIFHLVVPLPGGFPIPQGWGRNTSSLSLITHWSHSKAAVSLLFVSPTRM